MEDFARILFLMIVNKFGYVKQSEAGRPDFNLLLLYSLSKFPFCLERGIQFWSVPFDFLNANNTMKQFDKISVTQGPLQAFSTAVSLNRDVI